MIIILIIIVMIIILDYSLHHQRWNWKWTQPDCQGLTLCAFQKMKSCSNVSRAQRWRQVRPRYSQPKTSLSFLPQLLPGSATSLTLGQGTTDLGQRRLMCSHAPYFQSASLSSLPSTGHFI